MNKFKAAALEILSKSDSPLHSREITKRAISAGILETDGITPEQSMNSQLLTDIKNRGTASDFKKVGPSTFALNSAKTALINATKVLEIEREEDEKLVIESSYTGKAGEYLVCSELLFLGFNASIMSVDVGMDLAATKDKKLFTIQVKTANENKNAEYNFDIRKTSFERQQPGNIYYIFVLKGKNNNFLILTQADMDRKLHEKAILETDKKRKYRVKIFMKNKTVYMGSMKHEMRYYLNNWGIIK